MTTVAILPVKRLDGAKQRLGEALRQPAREVLAEAMAGDVLAVLGRVPGLARVILVAGDRRGSDLGVTAGVEVVEDPVCAGQSAAAELGLARARELGATRALLVPGDCPALDPAELSGLLDEDADDDSEVVIVPDRHGSGTNALLLAPPDVVHPAFGPGSRERHVDLAQAAGARWRVAQVASLGLDVDTPDDLAALRATLGRAEGTAPRTRAALARLAPAPA